MTNEEMEKLFWFIFNNVEMCEINGIHYYECQELFDVLDKYKEKGDIEMTIGGAISDLNNLLKADDIPTYYKPSIKKIIETIEMEQSNSDEDCISREAVIEHYNSGEILQCNHVSRNNLLDYIEGLPSIQPKAKAEPKIGHWIVHKDCEGKTRYCVCDLCGYETGKYTWRNPKYCAECGAKMEETE